MQKKTILYRGLNLSALSRTCKWYPVCPMKRFYEKGKLDKKWIERYCKGNWNLSSNSFSFWDF